MKEYGTLRGAIITLSRKGNVKNGEVSAVLVHKPNLGNDYPPDVDVRRHLERIWRITHSPLRTEANTDARTELRRNGLLGKPPATD